MRFGFDFATPLRASADPQEFRADFLCPPHGPDGSVTESARGILEYSVLLGFGYDAFRKFLQGKRILDLGSGCGVFAKECARQSEIDVAVYSVNPRLAISEWRMHERMASVRYTSREKVQAVHDQRAVAAWADALPFANDSFDAVFDVIAALNYSAQKRELYDNVAEIIRILKPGGVLIASLVSHTALPRIRYIEKAFPDSTIEHRYKSGCGGLAGFCLTKK